MRDWTRTLRRASFRGIPFQVEAEKLPQAGRNVVIHEPFRGEEHATEDTGRKAVKYKLTAYIASDSADVQAPALVAACSAPGAASLVLPLLGTKRVRCTAVETGHAKDKLGYVSFELEFVEAGGEPFPRALPIADRLLAGALDLLPAALGAAGVFGGALAMIGGVAGGLAGGVLGAVSGVRGIVAGLAGGFGGGVGGRLAGPIASVAAMNAVAATDVFRAAVPLLPADNAAALARHADLYAAAGAIASPAGAGLVAAHLAASVAAIGTAAPPDAVASAAAELLAGVALATPPTSSPARTAAGALADAVASAVEAAALGEVARATAAAPYADAPSRDGAAARLTALAEPVVERVGARLGEEPARLIAEAVSHAVAHLRGTPDAADVVRVDATASYPSGAAAWALYGDPARAADLAARNRVGTPLFMPARFDAPNPSGPTP